MRKLMLIGILVSFFISACSGGDSNNQSEDCSTGIPSYAVLDLGRHYSIVRNMVLRGKAIVEYTHKECGTDNPSSPPVPETNCYAFSSAGAHWHFIEPYTIDPYNLDNISPSEISYIISESISDWEYYAGVDIIGHEVRASFDRSSLGVYADGKNTIMFDGLFDTYSGALAVTYFWYSGSELVEWDIVINDQDYYWSIDGSLNHYDLYGVIKHEIGHAIGLHHPPAFCTEETMYAYTGIGETKKRSLNEGDISGIHLLYGH
jgi:hypothetical protein